MKHLTFLFIFVTQFVFSQDVDDIINRHKTAMGLTATPITSYKFTGDFYEKYFLITGTNHYTCTVYFKAPDLWRIEKTDLNGGDPILNESGIRIVHGNSTWRKNNNSSKVDSSDWNVYTNNLFMYTLPDYLCYTNVLTCTKDYSGVTPGGTDAQFFVTVPNRVTESTGTREYSTSISTKYITSIYEFTDNKPEKAVTLSDYKTVGGITYPAKMVDTWYPGGGSSWNFTKSNVEINIPLDDNLFKIPAAGETQAAANPVVPQENLAQVIANWEGAKATAMINAGADLNLPNAAGNKPLGVAVRNGIHPLVVLLLEKGVNVNDKVNSNGDTPLHIAAQRDNMIDTSFLISKGADINALNGEGLTPIQVADKMGYKDVVKLLKSNGAKK